MSWNYRVVKVPNPTDPEEPFTFGIHEAYYDGADKVNGWTERPVGIVGASVEELREVMKRMERALTEPVIEDLVQAAPEAAETEKPAPAAAKRVRIYACGTTPWELDPSNRGAMQVYLSQEAILQDVECAESCGVLEGWLELGAEVVAGTHRTLSAQEAEAREAEALVLVAKWEAACQGAPPEIVRSAALWLVGKIKRERRRAHKAAAEAKP